MNFFDKKATPQMRPFNYISGFMETNGLCPEALFNHILSWERKRTERSGRPFLLMLLDIQKINFNGNGLILKDKIAGALAKSTRDIDHRGWYVQDHVMGVIFSEFNDQDLLQARDQVVNRVRANLCESLSRQEFNQIDISLHVFPEGIEIGDFLQPSNQTLYPDLHMEHHMRSTDFILKRTVDILGSLLALILLSPVIILIALAIKLTSKGPVLYCQERVGRFGKRFTFFKFRSMKVNNDATIHKEYVQKLISGALSRTDDSQNNIYKIQRDPRVTAVGRFIRRTSLDEIPQFFNVLLGDMSLVGPRPPIPYELEKYNTWHRQRVLSMKPGITGLWQVIGRSRTTFDEMVRLDIHYIREWSFWLDLRLILATPWVALTGKGGF